MRLALIHQLPGSAPAPAGATTWRTCLREIHFLAGHEPARGDVLRDADAYELLLEVVAGLRSPLIGETEVQAQFKEFLASPAVRADRTLVRLGQRVLTDARRIRRKYLQGFGAHSYGRLAAAHLSTDRAVVIGTGALASQVVQAVPDSVAVDVWGRSAERVLPTRPRGLTFSLIADAREGLRGALPSAMVIAAPVGATDLDQVFSAYVHLTVVVDLRSHDQQTAISVDCPIVTLNELLAEAARDACAGASRVRAARAEIGSLAFRFAGHEQLRPFGWDDVCA